MDISEFLLKKGYQINSSTITPKGRGKVQYFCIIDKKPLIEDLEDCELYYGIDVLKCNFKKGRELTVLMVMKETEEQEKKEEIQNLGIDDAVDMIYNKDLSREHIKNILTMFKNSCYAKGYNTHRNAIRKLLNMPIDINNID